MKKKWIIIIIFIAIVMFVFLFKQTEKFEYTNNITPPTTYRVKINKHLFYKELIVEEYRSCSAVDCEGTTKKNKVIHIERFAKSSPSYRCFAYAGDNNSYNLRLFCYSCLFKAKSRYGDLTVGDPWFINDTCITNPILKSSNVIRTLYSVNTTKGIFLKKAIIPFLIEEKLSWNLSFCQPAVHATKRLIPPLREILYSKLDTTDYGELVEHLLNCDLDLAQKKFESKYKLYIIKTIIKKILPLNLIWKIKKIISTI